jgi:PmbA protein
MLIENRVSSRLVSVLLQALSASLLATGRTFLADKLGLQVVSPLLSLVDNPCVLQGLGSRPFDSEGVALRRRDLFRDGKPVQWLADSYYAAKLGIPHTSTSTGNILFECETQPLESLLKVSSPTIWVKSFNGGNSNQLTGDFSYGISGLLLRPNEAPQAVSEMVLSGNILELFSRLVAVANDPNPNASMRSPSLLFDSVSFSGK